MSDYSLPANRKKKITYTTSIKGVEKAEKALVRLGFESKANFAESQLLSRSTVTKFFGHQPIQLDSFKRICDALKLEWEQIREIEEVSAPSLDLKQCSTLSMLEEVRQVITAKQVTIIDKDDKTIKAVIVLEGDINSINNNLFLLLELCLRKYSGDTIKITDIQEGSIKIFVEGSQEDIQKLISCIKSEEVTEINSFPVKSIQILNESCDDTESEKKWCLVKEIKAQGAKGRDLKGADLSDANLSGTDLSDADLSDTDLSDADLSRAYLSHADLSDANLKGADLRGANLHAAYLSHANLITADLSDAYFSGADLRGADLRDTNLSRANLSDAYLSRANLITADLSNAFLSGADLSDADLKGADLSGTILRSANLSDADLSGTNLSNAILIDANLTGANLTGANLSRAYLSRADLSRADLSGANVTNTQFGNNEGISEFMKQELIKRGAIFEDSPGDRSRVLV